MIPPRTPGFDPLFVLMLALVADACFGEPRWLYDRIAHPVALIGRAVTVLDARLNRPKRSEGARRIGGVLVLTALVIVAGGLGWIVQETAARAPPYGWIPDLLLTTALIAQRSLSDHVTAVVDGLRDGGLSAGRRAVAMIVGRDVRRLDEHGVSRAAIESCAENLSDGVTAPLFWACVGGLPGLSIYKTVNTLDSMIGHRNARYRAFGHASARFDDLLNLIPARLCGLLLCLAAMMVKDCSARNALRVLLRDARAHRSPNAGWPEAAMAGALRLRLAGPRAYRGHAVNGAWLGDGRAEASAADIRRSLRLMWTVCALQGALVGLLWALKQAAS